MSNIDGINKNIPANHMKQNDKTGQNPKVKKGVDFKAAEQNSTLQVNKLLIELTLNIKIESKYNFETQAGTAGFMESTSIDLSQILYNGKPVTELTQDEAKSLISDDGYFSIENTAQRLFDFAVKMAGDDAERLKVTRDAVLKGFKEAEGLFGGKLPEISYKTIDMALKMIDEKIREFGGSVIDVEA